MAKFKRIFGVIIIMALLLMSSVTFVTPLATAAGGDGESEGSTPCEACGMGIEAVPIEEVEPEEDTSGLVPLGPAHMILEDMVLINQGEPVEETTPLPTGWQTIMSDGFEGAYPGVWDIYVGPADAYWGWDDANPFTGSYSAFCGKYGTESVVPGENYPDNMETWMDYGPFSLADATDAKVDYWLWLDAEDPYDSFWYLASIDGLNWYGGGWTGYSAGWVAESFDLTSVDTLGNLCGQSNVWITFIFESDVSNPVDYYGAFIDDVVLQKYVGVAQFDLEAVEAYLSTIPGDSGKTSVVDTPTVGQDVYLHFKWNCIGSGTTPIFRTELKLDGTALCYDEDTAEGGYSYTVWCPSPWTATAGAHTVTGVLDVYDDVSESNETNNEAGKSWGGAPPEATWTFMVYSDGDNNLEESEIASFNHMELSADNTNVNVIVQLDRIPGYDSSNGDWTTTRRYELKYDTDINNFASYTQNVDYWELGELNMAAPDTLIDFVSWAKTNYPADHYCLVLSNHGSGWEPKSIGQSVPKGILWDDTSVDYMSTADLGSAMSSVTSGGTEKLDVLFLDACLMQMIEVGYEVKDYSQYLVASEYIGWGSVAGWSPYDNYILSITSTTTAPQLATAIVNEYHSDLAATIYAHTMSAVDPSQYSGLALALDNFAQALTAGLPTYQADIESSRTACQKFYYDSYIDLYHFAFLIDQNVADATIQTTAQAVMTAVNNAVIAETHEDGSGGEYYQLDNAHGISIYFPASEGDSYYSNYNSSNLVFVADKGWDEFLTAFFNPGAGEVNISLQPSTEHVGVGEVFDLIIQAEAGDQPVSGISAFIDFDPTYLEVLDADTGTGGIQITPGSTLTTVLLNEADNSMGTIDYSAGKLGGPFPTGTFTVATVQFKALTETDPSTAIDFSTTDPRETAADYAGSDVTGTITGGTVSITLDAPVFLDPASSENICIGQTFSLEIKADVDDEQPVSGVQAFIDFDPAYLEVQSVTPGPALPTVVQNIYNNSAGTIDYSAGKLGEPFPTGTFTVATIEFKALAETSSTTAVTFSFAGSRKTIVDFGGNPIPGTHGDATVEIIPGALADISVVLQGGSRPDEGWEIPITIKFFSPGADVMTDSPLYEFSLTTTKSDGIATCQCTGVMPDTYDITAVSEHTLINVKRNVVISTPSTAVDMGTLLEGNANDDIIINISDFGILAVSYMKMEGEPGYDARADFDRNGIINISDFGLLAVNYMIMSPVDVSV